MHADRVEVFNRADDHDVVIFVAHHFEFVFFPPKNRFFEQNLGGRRILDTCAGNAVKIFFVVGHAGAKSAHGEGRTHDHGVTELFGRFKSFRHGVHNDRTCRFAARALYHAFERFTIFAQVYGFDICANEFNIVFAQSSLLIESNSSVECSLSAQGRKNGVWTFFFDNLSDDFGGNRLNIGGICKLRVGHNGRRIGVYEDNAHTFFFEHA